MKITNMRKGSWGKLTAFFDVATDEGFIIKGFKLVNGINGPFVGFPSQKGNDDEYYDTIYADRELKEELSQMAIDYYGQEVMPTDTDMPTQKLEGESTDSTLSKTDTAVPESGEAPTFTDDDIPF